MASSCHSVDRVQSCGGQYDSSSHLLVFDHGAYAQPLSSARVSKSGMIFMHSQRLPGRNQTLPLLAVGSLVLGSTLAIGHPWEDMGVISLLRVQPWPSASSIEDWGWKGGLGDKSQSVHWRRGCQGGQRMRRGEIQVPTMQVFDKNSESQGDEVGIWSYGEENKQYFYLFLLLNFLFFSF